MLRSLIHRPIAVSMCLIAIAVVGILSLRYIPVSLLPDIDVPQITVQVLYPGASVSEVEEKATRPLRRQLLQVAGLKEIRSESRMDAGTIRMAFEPGSDMDLIFIDVNEKVDRAMRFLPVDTDRPKVMKASAMDIPAFYLDMVLCEDAPSAEAALRFASLGKFARDVVARRIEQLPETAMVDVSGTWGTEIDCIPDPARMQALGLTTPDIRRAITDNNITLAALSIVDGIYRYNIHFDSRILTVDDIRDIRINHEGRLVTLGELCDITERPSVPAGLVRSDGKLAVTMAVIKQNDAQMESLQEGMDTLLEDFSKEFPEINFRMTRDQTRLLTYSIENLRINLLLGALLASLILFVFMRDWRPTVLIIVTIPISLIVTLLFFYLLHISINVISLSGLILGVGMMVDNSIIVIDNIRQRALPDVELAHAVVEGTKEVFVPMLSSVLTTCSVFIPLVFLSGTAGALFYDQAMAVSIALFSSLGVSVLVIPVYYFLLHKGLIPGFSEGGKRHGSSGGSRRLYVRIHSHMFRHMWLYISLSLLCLPLTAWLFTVIDKERMPYIAPEDALVTIDWNTGISAQENDRRTAALIDSVAACVEHTTVMAGAQQFLMPHTKELTASETVVYIKCRDAEAMGEVRRRLEKYVAERWYRAGVSFESASNLYELIFSTGESDLEIRLQTADGGRPSVRESREFVDSLRSVFPSVYIRPVMTEENLRYMADIESMALYGVTYLQLYDHLREAVRRNRVYEISEGAYSIPVIVGNKGNEADRIMSGAVRNRHGVEIPVSMLLKEVRDEDYKRLSAAGTGDYYPIKVDADSRTVRDIISYADGFVKRNPKYTLSYGGEYFSSRLLVKELTTVLTVSLALLFLILAAQFESLVQPLIILFEMVVDICAVFIVLWLTGETLNIMSMTGLVVMAGIIINDSILKVDTINRLRRGGMSVLRAVVEAGERRLRPILMTSFTTILALLPFLSRSDMGSALQYPLSLTLVVGMTIGTAVSLFLVPLLYYVIYRKRCKL
ncbi:MAG: efflux RND transporter permease subunit [Muribaculaceae bacterium]|nr:efflux RND transporter permease subunit [Muribaculaceae bacterium]MDE6795665.1 efflux RND transporter permease subunit [Muribaculaceae bacterium]